MKHLIKKEKNILHGTIGWSHNGKDGQYCEAGETVKIKWQPTAGWGLQELHYTDGGGNVVAIDGGEFVMPDSAVVIGATFKRFVLQDWTEGINPTTGDILEVGANGEPTPSGVQVSDVVTKQELGNSMFDKSKTYLSIITGASKTFAMPNLFDAANPNMTVDWGDGTFTNVTSSDDLSHTYPSANTEYLVTISGVTKIPYHTFYDKDTLKKIYLGNTVTTLANQAIYSNKYLAEVHFLGGTIPTWGSGAITVSGAYRVKRICVPDEAYANWVNNPPYNMLYNTTMFMNESQTHVVNRGAEFTVGTGGDFTTIKEALFALSLLEPVYKYSINRSNIVLKIKNGTIINENVCVYGQDLSYITITYEGYDPNSLSYDTVAAGLVDGSIVFDTTEGYNSVMVDASSFGDSTHDTRADVVLFRAENGGKLPNIGCVFKLQTPHASLGCAGIVCNKSSEAVVNSLCGFIGFQDGVISNNESSITIREGITINCGRWGVHARHNGEVSARSLIALGCATLANYSDGYAAASADRVADLDVRKAYLQGNVAIKVSNASSACAREAYIINSAAPFGKSLVFAEYSGRVNASEATFTNCSGTGIDVGHGGLIDAFDLVGSPTIGKTLNTLTSDGVVFG